MTQERAWYRKYRPRTFEDYEGDFINSAVKRISDPVRRPQVVLLHGVHGCGKTTAARLLSGYYLCESLTPAGHPCGNCSGCMQLQDLIERGEDDGSSESIQEINGSEHNGVEAIKRIMNESMLTLPAFSKYKVFIFDECHRITHEAQNALLKVLEDVPEHLIVIFATTEYDKMLPTILSRCQLVVEVRKQTLQGMTRILKNIAKQEGLTIDENALKLIAKKSKRIPRNSINLLEDVAVTYDNKVTTANVLEKIGEADTQIYQRFMEIALNKAGEKPQDRLTGILTLVHELAEGDIDHKTFLTGLSRFVMEGIYIRMGIGEGEMDKASLDARKVLFEHYKIDEFHLLLNLVNEAVHRSTIDAQSSELALTLLALNIGGIKEKADIPTAETIKADVEVENTMGSKKYVERDREIRYEEKESKTKGSVELDDFLAQLGAVQYNTTK